MNVRVGRYYEKKAFEYLKKIGHVLIYKNFYTPYGEVDIISEYQGKVYFTEVKYLQSDSIINPIIKVDNSKIRKIFFSISYLKKFCRLKNYQVDSVVVYKVGKEMQINYFQDLRLL